MSKLDNQWIDIFRAGNYGEKGTFTEADLDRVAAGYDPAAHEAPVTIGHPKDNLPAFGWVSKLKRVGALLQAQFSQVDPGFAAMVEDGKFNKRSASLYKHPETGQVVGLRHVAFLGAQPPEVKGLRPIQFHDEGQKSTEVDFAMNDQESSMADEANFVERIIAKIEERFGKKPETSVTAPVTFSEEQVKALVIELVKPLEAKLAAHDASFSESQTATATAATRARAAESVAKLKASGKWVPAFERMGLNVVFDELAKSTETVEFGEGDAKKKVTPLEAFVGFMEQLPAIVPAAAVYTGQQGAAAPKGMKGVNAAPGKVDGNSVRLHEAALDFAEKNKTDYATAMFKVAADHPELTVPGGAAAGAV